VGDAGVGKTAIVEGNAFSTCYIVSMHAYVCMYLCMYVYMPTGIARRIASGHVPTSLQGNLFSLNVAHLLSGTKYRGEFESRVQGMLHDIQQTQEPVILFIDELHTIVGTGAVRDSTTDLASLLKPMLARGELCCIGATTLDEYRQYIEKDTALERRFQPVYVDEPSPNATMAIIQGIRRSYELHHSVLIQRDTLTHAVQLTDRYVSDRKLPDKAIDALDEACAAVALRVNTTTADNRMNQWNDHVRILYTRLRTAEENGEYARALDLRYGAIPEALAQCNCRPQTSRPATYVTPDDVAAVVAQWTGIPVERLHESDTRQLLDLPARLQTRIRGQSQAIQAVSDAIIRSKTGMSDATRPIGVFLFLGPTGVGKTELAKAICAEVFQQSETQMVRLDMSEYMESHSVSRLLGAPPGYVRSDEGGQLTEPVRRRPYNVVLLDEIEKAHTLVLNTLLQVFEDGRLTDAQGRHVNFTNTVIIMTSNLGSTFLTSSTLNDEPSDDINKDKDKDNDRNIIPAAIQRQVLEHVREFFSPELFNRIDQTVLFHPLRRCDLEGILDAQTQKLQENLQKRDGKTHIRVSLSPEVRRFTLETVYDPSMGARPLIRWVEQNIASALSTRLLRGDIPPRSHVIVEMGSSKEELLFTIHDESHTRKCDPRPWITPSSW
jgi:ATP-dependent Clp protease ATP-binding subunit ClpC